MRITIVLTLLLLVASQGCASNAAVQKADSIRASSDYHFGEGFGATELEAQNAAVRALAQRIQSNIQKNQAPGVREATEAFADTFVATSTVVVMNQLDGLEYIDLGRVEDRFLSLAYIENEELNSDIDRQKNRIRPMVEHAEQARQDADIHTAARDAYWAYLLAHTVLDTFKLDLPTGSTNDAKFDLLYYLQTMLAGLQFKAGETHVDGPEIRVPINVLYEGEPVESLVFSYNTGAGDG